MVATVDVGVLTGAGCDLPPGKFRPPALPRYHVPRPRLQAVLDGITPGGVGLVVGPAGSGKTTAVREWVDGLDVPWAWLQHDELDREPFRWWQAVVGAYRRHFPGVGQEVLDELEVTGTQPSRHAVARLLDEVAASGKPFVLVLDDLHLAPMETSCLGDAWRVPNLPPNFRLVVTTRREPGWPKARWRASGLLSELGFDDLRFDEAEARSLLEGVLGQTLDDDLVRTVVQRTDGWGGPLLLAGLGLRRHPDDASDFAARLSGTLPAIADLLSTEVLAGQDPTVVDFLVDTSPLDLLAPDPCGAVGERADAGDLLRAAHAGQLVRQLELSDTWALPRLLRDLLRARLRGQGQGREVGSLTRAARFYADAGKPEIAARHAMAAGDPRLSHELFMAHGETLARRGSGELALAWSRTLAGDVLDEDPLDRLQVAWVVNRAGAISDADMHIARAERATALPPEAKALITCLRWWSALRTGHVVPVEPDGPEIDGRLRDHPAFGARWLMLANTLLCAGEVEAAAAACEAGIRDPAPIRVISEHARLAILADLAWARGELRDARQYVEAGNLAWRSSGAPAATANLPAFRAAAGVAMEDGDLAAAGAHLDEAERVVAHVESTGVVVGQIVVSRSSLLRASGETAGALELLEQTRRRWAASAGPPAGPALVTLLAAEEVRARLGLGDVAGARAALAVARPRPGSGLLAARVMLADGDPDGAEAVLGEPRPATPRASLEALLLGARATRDAAEARHLTREALTLGMTYGFLRSLVDEEALHNHYRALYRLAPSPAVVRVAVELEARLGGTTGPGLVERLTDRELDVLRLLPSNLANQEIAGSLGVSLNTTKTHLKGLYRKIGVDSRSAAVEHGRRLGLIR